MAALLLCGTLIAACGDGAEKRPPQRAAPPVGLPPGASPPGRIAFVNADGVPTPIYAIRADGRGRLDELRPGGGIVRAFGWAPDGRRIAYIEGTSGRRATLATLAVVSGRTRVVRDGAPDSLFELAWAPRGDVIALLRGSPADPTRARIDVMGLDGGVTRGGLAPDAFELSRISWAPDGRQVVYRRRHGRSLRPFGQLSIVTVSSGERRVLPSPEPATDPAWSPDRALVAFATARGIATIQPSGRGYRLVTAGGTHDLTPTWSPDGRWIAFAHQTGDCSRPPGCRQDLNMVGRGGGPTYYIRRTSELAETQPQWAP